MTLILDQYSMTARSRRIVSEIEKSMKIINANSEIPGMNSREEVESLLGSRLNLQTSDH